MSEEPILQKIEFPDEKGGLTLQAKHPAFAALAADCVRLFKEEGGVNYCELRMQSGDPAFGVFTVAIQRESGKTVAQVNGELRAEIAEKSLQIDALRKSLGRCGGNHHDDGCASCISSNPGKQKPCNCGWEAVEKWLEGCPHYKHSDLANSMSASVFRKCDLCGDTVRQP